MLDQIVGTALRNNLTPPSDIIIKCRSATQTAYTAIKEYELNRQIIIHIDDCLEEYSRDGE